MISGRITEPRPYVAVVRPPTKPALSDRASVNETHTETHQDTVAYYYHDRACSAACNEYAAAEEDTAYEYGPLRTDVIVDITADNHRDRSDGVSQCKRPS